MQATEAATSAAIDMVSQRVGEAVQSATAPLETRVAGAEQAVEFVQQQQHGTQVLYTLVFVVRIIVDFKIHAHAANVVFESCESRVVFLFPIY
jgi:hypothetical protein